MSNQQIPKLGLGDIIGRTLQIQDKLTITNDNVFTGTMLHKNSILSIISQDQQLRLESSQAATNAVRIQASQATGGIDIDAGITSGPIDIDAGGPITIDTTDTISGIAIGANTANIPITIGNATSIVTIADNLIVGDSITVNSIDTTSAVPLVLGASTATAITIADTGIITTVEGPLNYLQTIVAGSGGSHIGLGQLNAPSQIVAASTLLLRVGTDEQVQVLDFGTGVGTYTYNVDLDTASAYEGATFYVTITKSASSNPTIVFRNGSGGSTLITVNNLNAEFRNYTFSFDGTNWIRMTSTLETTTWSAIEIAGTAVANSIAIGLSSSASGDRSISIGRNALATTENSVAIGYNASANGANFFNTAVGNAASAANNGSAFGVGATANTGNNTTAIGRNATATANQGTALGNASSCTAANGAAVGSTANVSAVQGIAIGSASICSGANAIAIGSSPDATATRSIAIGTNALSAYNDNISIGYNTHGGMNSVVIGRNAYCVSGYDSGIAIGINAHVQTNSSVAIGNSVTTTGDGATAICTSAIAATRAVAIGQAATANSSDAICIGFSANSAVTAGNNCVCIGSNSTASGNSSVAVGNSATTSAANGISLGSLTNPNTSFMTGASSVVWAEFNVASVVTQATSLSTNISTGQETRCGYIQLQSTALGIGASTTFTWTNNFVRADTMPIISHTLIGTGTNESATVTMTVSAANTLEIRIFNNTSATLDTTEIYRRINFILLNTDIS